MKSERIQLCESQRLWWNMCVCAMLKTFSFCFLLVTTIKQWKYASDRSIRLCQSHFCLHDTYKRVFFQSELFDTFLLINYLQRKKSVILMPRKKKTNLYSRYETNKKWDDNMLNKTSALLCWLSSCLRDFHVIKYQISLRWMFFHHCWMVK